MATAGKHSFTEFEIGCFYELGHYSPDIVGNCRVDDVDDAVPSTKGAGNIAAKGCA